MNLDKQICWIDVESTGVDAVTSRIIEFAAVVMEPDRSMGKWYVQRFNPGVPIPPEATEIHGITDEMVKDCPPFAEHAQKILAGLRGKDIGGYNLWRLDLPLLDEESRRCGLRLDLTGVRVIDCYGIFAKKHPRDLAAAVKLFCGEDHTEKHGARADAIAAARVFLGQLASHQDLEAMSLDELIKFSQHEDYQYADLARKLYIDSDGDMRYAFGPHKDVKVRSERGFAKWMYQKDFSGSTLDALDLEMNRVKEQESQQKTLGLTQSGGAA